MDLSQYTDQDFEDMMQSIRKTVMQHQMKMEKKDGSADPSMEEKEPNSLSKMLVGGEDDSSYVECCDDDSVDMEDNPDEEVKPVEKKKYTLFGMSPSGDKVVESKIKIQKTMRK